MIVCRCVKIILIDAVFVLIVDGCLFYICGKFLRVMGLLGAVLLSLVSANVADTAIAIGEVGVSASFKTVSSLKQLPLASSSFNMKDIERRNVHSISDFAVATPNLHIPEYGSKMTSSIYIRGIGGRIDNPAVGMYVDQVPYLNKNGYDADLWDVRRIDVLRGPQGTLFGRNTIGGIINIVTLSPLDYTGTRISLEASNGESARLSASTYQRPNDGFGYSIGISGQTCGGYFTNACSGVKCDWEKGASVRFRLAWRNLAGWRAESTSNIDYSDGGGYAYAMYDTALRKTLPIAYNDECGYTRTHITEGIVLQRDLDRIQVQNVVSWQFLDDDMRLDQDFTPKSMFTLRQKQSEHALTAETVVRSKPGGQRMNWLGGVSLLYRYNKMSAPVVFKSDGINELILANANAGIQQVFADAAIVFQEDEFAIESHFTSPTIGAAAYCQTECRLGNLAMTAGIRIDFEHIGFDYRNSADLHYLFTMTMNSFKPLHTAIAGSEGKTFVELLPKLSLQYASGGQSVYAAMSRGFKSGGFNSQMFSDILQNRMKADLMKSLGVYFDDGLTGYSIDEVIGYRPEHDWNYEVGSHLRLLGGKAIADLSVFVIDCRDQQLTVFPDGKTTGRMMTNAGRSRSCGAEAALSASVADGLVLSATYGYTNATFTDYDSGIADYTGNCVPYVPRHTVSALAGYSFNVGGRFIQSVSFQAQYTGAGRIYWDEANSVWQDYYSQLSASAGIGSSMWSLTLWGKNLTNADFSNFHFVSVGNTFLSKGKPLRAGLSLKLYL